MDGVRRVENSVVQYLRHSFMEAIESMSTPHTSPSPSFLRSLARFFGEYFIYLLPSAFIIYLVLESYQIDFRPYYIAGKSILFGLDPYLNHVNDHPEFYTPVNANISPGSGFIYPPFASLLFAPFAMLRYANAKLYYSIFILILLWLLLFELVRYSQFETKGETLLFVMASFPVFANFERGQIDILVCYLTILSFLTYQRRQPQAISGFLLALACCIKLFPGIAVLYYLYKREYKLIAYTFGFIGFLFLSPIAYFGPAIYTSYVKRILPQFFGALSSPVPISTHGQAVVDRVVKSFDSNGLRATHDFVHGYMNPFLRNNLVGAVIVGAIAFSVLLYYLRHSPVERQFFSVMNSIYLFNPQTWIMGLVWYIPLFVYLFGKVNHLGKFVLVLPLMMPPFTNTNGMLAYAITLAFAIPKSRDRLIKGHELLQNA
ncbi:glycosyltransferase family 87 protein [Phormidesmis sp. 146-33]